eukprot:1327874-Amorphochlora_amoeboformis.AAC.1
MEIDPPPKHPSSITRKHKRTRTREYPPGARDEKIPTVRNQPMRPVTPILPQIRIEFHNDPHAFIAPLMSTFKTVQQRYKVLTTKMKQANKALSKLIKHQENKTVPPSMRYAYVPSLPKTLDSPADSYEIKHPVNNDSLKNLGREMEQRLLEQIILGRQQHLHMLHIDKTNFIETELNTMKRLYAHVNEHIIPDIDAYMKHKLQVYIAQFESQTAIRAAISAEKERKRQEAIMEKKAQMVVNPEPPIKEYTDEKLKGLQSQITFLKTQLKQAGILAKGDKKSRPNKPRKSKRKPKSTPKATKNAVSKGRQGKKLRHKPLKQKKNHRKRKKQNQRRK